MPDPTVKERATDSLRQIQLFDPESLRRTRELGETMDFAPIIGSAQNIVDLYKRIPLSSLDHFSDAQNNKIIACANQDNQLFDRIMQFQIDGDSPSEVRSSLIVNVGSRFDQAFAELINFIAYVQGSDEEFTNARSKLEQVQLVWDNTRDQVSKEADALKRKSEDALAKLKEFTSEMGVSQQAIYFRDEAEKHDRAAEKWKTWTIWAAGLLVGSVVLLSILFYWLDTDASLGNAAIIHVISGKLVVFAALGYLLILCGKSYLSSRHNAVVNRHRHNALLTYSALVTAAAKNENADIVLNHAAGCIFSPQDTGYAKVGDSSGSPTVQIIKQAESSDKQ